MGNISLLLTIIKSGVSPVYYEWEYKQLHSVKFDTISDIITKENNNSYADSEVYVFLSEHDQKMPHGSHILKYHIATIVSFSLAWTLPAQTTDLYLLHGSSPIPFTIRYVLKGCIVWPFMNIHVFAYLGKMFAFTKLKNYGGGVGWNGQNEIGRSDLW